ncbi:MAG: hypothetical protein WCB68_04215, partial [Pyrinomonadaceae bacterium]
RDKPSVPVSTKNLSRERAADLIKIYPNFKSTFDRKIPVGRFWYDVQNIEYFLYGDLLPLVDQGILTLTKTGKKQYSGRYIEQIVELTPKGEVEAKAWVKTSENIKDEFEIFGPDSPDVTIYRMVIADKELVEVTGIATDEGGKTARVEFTWRWAPTAQAKLLPKKVPSNETHECAAYFQLYDDGWRIVKPFCP